MMSPTKEDVHSRFRAALKNKLQDIPPDVTFTVGMQRQKLSCHKLILSIASPVFEAMFSDRHNQGISKSSKGHDEIHIPEMDYIGFKNVIRCAYTGNNKVAEKDALATIFAADFYNIPDLVEDCSNWMKKILNAERNAVTIYQTAILLNNKELFEEACYCICEQFAKIVVTDQFLEFSEDNLCRFLKMKNLKIGSQAELFKAVLRWTRNQCDLLGLDNDPGNCRRLLKNVLPLIRFPPMNSREIDSLMESSGTLMKETFDDLQKYFASSTSDGTIVSMKSNYTWDEGEDVNIFEANFTLPSPNFFINVGQSPYYKPDRFRVSGDVPATLQLREIGVFLGVKKKIEITIHLFEWDLKIGPLPTKYRFYAKLLLESTRVAPPPDESGLVFVDVREPVLIQPDRIYAIAITHGKRNLKFVRGLNTPKSRGILWRPSLDFCRGIKCICPGKEFAVHLDLVEGTIYSIRFRY